MLNGNVEPVDANERSRQTVRPYQSLWLAHWKHTGCSDSTSPSASPSEELAYVSRKDVLTKGVEASSSGGLTKKRVFDIGDGFIKMDRGSTGNDRVITTLDDQDADALSRLKSFKESFVESLSHVSAQVFGIETDKFDKGKTTVSIGFRQTSADMRMPEHEHCCEHRRIDL